MRAILCELPGPYARPGPGPAGPGAAAVDELGASYYALGTAAIWAQHVAAAEALLAAQRAVAGRHARGGCGLARGPFAAACAARLAAPDTLQVVEPGQEAAFLAPLPLAHVPGLAPGRRAILEELRLFTLGDLAAVPSAVLAAVLGPDIQVLQAGARGREDTVGGGWLPVPVQFAAAQALTPAQTARLLTAGALAAPAARLAGALADAGRAAQTLTLTVGFAGRPPLAGTARLPAPAGTAEALIAAAWPVLARTLRSARRRPTWLRLAALRTCTAAIQPPLPLPDPDEYRVPSTEYREPRPALDTRYSALGTGRGRLPASHVLRPPARP